MKRDVLILLAVSALAAAGFSYRPKAAPPQATPVSQVETSEFSFATFQAACELAHLENARLVNSSTPQAEQMWARGQLRIPDEPSIVGDFNGDGILDRGLPVQTDLSLMLLVISPANRPNELLARIDYLTAEQVADPTFLETQARECLTMRIGQPTPFESR